MLDVTDDVDMTSCLPKIYDGKQNAAQIGEVPHWYQTLLIVSIIE